MYSIEKQINLSTITDIPSRAAGYFPYGIPIFKSDLHRIEVISSAIKNRVEIFLHPLLYAILAKARTLARFMQF